MDAMIDSADAYYDDNYSGLEEEEKMEKMMNQIISMITFMYNQSKV